LERARRPLTGCLLPKFRDGPVHPKLHLKWFASGVARLVWTGFTVSSQYYVSNIVVYVAYKDTVDEMSVILFFEMENPLTQRASTILSNQVLYT
jgi:hypothetical protein